jgi:hypothetical protein
LVPRLQRYYESLRLPVIHPGGLVSSHSGTVVRPFSCPATADALPRAGQRLLAFFQRRNLWTTETTGSPRFLANPRSHALLVRLRWTRDARPARRRRCCLPIPGTRSASTNRDFGALYTAYDLAVYASSLRLSPRRKTRFRLAATLDRSGFQPAGFVQEVSALPLVTLDSRHLFPLLQAFPGARLAPSRCQAPLPWRHHRLRNRSS